MHQWYYVIKRQQKGPIQEDELIKMLNEGHLSPKTMVWNQEMQDWTPANQITDLHLDISPSWKDNISWIALAIVLVIVVALKLYLPYKSIHADHIIEMPSGAQGREQPLAGSSSVAKEPTQKTISFEDINIGSGEHINNNQNTGSVRTRTTKQIIKAEPDGLKKGMAFEYGVACSAVWMAARTDYKGINEESKKEMKVKMTLTAAGLGLGAPPLPKGKNEAEKFLKGTTEIAGKIGEVHGKKIENTYLVGFYAANSIIMHLSGNSNGRDVTLALMEVFGKDAGLTKNYTERIKTRVKGCRTATDAGRLSRSLEKEFRNTVL